VSHKPNAAFQLVNAALAQGGSVALAPDMMKTAEGTEKEVFVISGIGHSAMAELATKFSVGVVSIPSARSCDSDQEGQDRPLSSVERVNR